MGCGGSKLEELEAVALCRDRSGLLADAIRHRYALADAHAAYARSLRSSGHSLHRFLDAIRSLPPPPDEPVLPLPSQRKGGGDPLPAPPAAAPQHSHSHSGSHIEFHDSDSDSYSPLHSSSSSPIHHHDDGDDADPPAPIYVTNYNYARSAPPPVTSVTYEQPEPVQFGGGGGFGEQPMSYFGYPYPAAAAQTSGFSPYTYPYSYPSSDYNAGFFGGAASPPANVPAYAAAPASTSRAPPPPPSPPRASNWDFLNPFGGYNESYEENVRYPSYPPSRSSNEVREEEGIPDLEDDEHEVVKEVYREKKLSGELRGKAAGKVEEMGGDGEGSHDKPSWSEASSSSSDSDVHVVEKNVVADEVVRQEEEQQQQQQAGAVAAPRKYNDLSEVVVEIKDQFDKASGSIEEVSKMLEVGKIPYRQKNSAYKVSTRMICGVAYPSASKNEFLEFEEDKVMESGSLSSTLQKLYMWELKLYDEVKVEEKLRVVLERECEHLRRLVDRGAEAHKLEEAQTLIRKLSTKIRMAIQIVKSISNTINKLRDEELWLQISELIQGLMRMWGVMLECHRTQFRAISEATIGSGGRLSDAHMEATKQLELELLDLIACFSAWVSTQKSFVKSLNDWLLKGLHYVQEETSDGIAPFSPGRMGAPPVFVICNYWSQSIDRISEREVVDAMMAFASNVLGLWEQHKFEQRQGLMANKDMDRTLKILEREEHEMQRAVEAQNKKLLLVSGHGGLTLSGQVHHGHTTELNSLQLNLRQIFEAMESFTATSAKAYEELHLRAEEESLAKANS